MDENRVYEQSCICLPSPRSVEKGVLVYTVVCTGEELRVVGLRNGHTLKRGKYHSLTQGNTKEP